MSEGAKLPPAPPVDETLERGGGGEGKIRLVTIAPFLFQMGM